jgi:large subunit ribosomal protein L13
MRASQKTYTPRSGDLSQSWRVVDAEGQILGRLASEIAGYLRGKHRPGFAEHMDVGDHVIVLNAALIRVTGDKLRQKMYYRHSGYPGGFKSVALGDMLAKHPDRVIKHAIRGMLPHNTLGRKMLKKLKIYAGADHPHKGQLHAGTSRRAERRVRAATIDSNTAAPAATSTTEEQTS